MGRTYHKSSKSFDDSDFGNRSGKPAKHSNGKKTGGMRTINNYVEEDDYDLNDDSFDDEIEIDDEIQIQHTKNKP
jgi:hypothetical protein